MSDVIKFPTIKPATGDEDLNDALNASIDNFKEEIEKGARGFITFLFDKEGTPSFILSGDLDPLRVLGAADILKLNMANLFVNVDG